MAINASRLAKSTSVLFLAILFSSTLYAQFGLPKVSGSDKPRAKFADVSVKLGEAFPILSVYGGAPDFDGIGEKVSYKTVGKGNYDDLFKEAASINGRTQETKFLLSKYGKSPSDFATNSAKLLKDKAEAKVAELTDFKKLLPKLSESTHADKDRAKEALSALSELKPQDDFSPLDLDGITKAISKAKSNLEETTSEAPKLIDELSKLSK